MVNGGIVANVIGLLLILMSGFLLLPIPINYFTGSAGATTPLVYSAIISLVVGGIIFFSSRNAKKNIGRREGFLIVSTGWLILGIISSLPYILGNILPDIPSALFESISGLTTTGATVLEDIEAVPSDILIWRSFTQWIGGMGIIVLTVAIFPLLGIGGVELFVAEAPGPTSDKINPRIKETAKRLWLIYVGLTTLLIIILKAIGLTLFDAINHGLTTMATGGFSTKNASLAHFNMPALEYIVALFMFIAGVNYTIIYFALKGNFKKVWASEEFKTYARLVAILSIVVTGLVLFVTNMGFEASFRASLFHIVSLITTTGFVATDYTAWSPGLTMIFFLLLFVGACAGSTSGGIKIIRHLVFFRHSFSELKRLLHPHAIIRAKVDEHVVPSKVMTHILVFLLIYLLLFVVGSIVMSFIFASYDNAILLAIGSVATSLGNVGPAIAELGPVDNFSIVPNSGKCILSLFMLLGRLELFTIVIILTPYFWRSN